MYSAVFMEVLKAVEENAETSNRESASALLRGHSSTMWTFLTPSPCGPTWFFGRSPKKPCVLFEYPSPVIAIFLWFYLKSSDFIYLVWEGTKHFCSGWPTTNTPSPFGQPWFIRNPLFVHMVCGCHLTSFKSFSILLATYGLQKILHFRCNFRQISFL